MAILDRVKTMLGLARPVIRDAPFSGVIKLISGQEVLPIDVADPRQIELLNRIDQAMQSCVARVRREPIVTNRPNEAGNKIEKPLAEELERAGLEVRDILNARGKKQATGYPDLLVCHDGVLAYVECKTYSAKNENSANRSFYFSPSDSFKVTETAHHLLAAFELEVVEIDGEKGRAPSAYKLTDLSGLGCTLKLEFNASNRALYDQNAILLEG